MFFHIVMMQLNEKADKDFFQKMDLFAKQIRNETEGVIHFHYGFNEADRSDGLNYALISSFTNSQAHDIYQACPAHQDIKSYMKDYIVRMAVYDGTVPTEI